MRYFITVRFPKRKPMTLDIVCTGEQVKAHKNQPPDFSAKH